MYDYRDVPCPKCGSLIGILAFAGPLIEVECSKCFNARIARPTMPRQIRKDFDSETFLIEPGRQIPPLVCVQWCDTDLVCKSRSAVELRRWNNREARAAFVRDLQDPEVVFTGHNLAYDLAVLAEAWPETFPLILDALDANRMFCTVVLAKLVDIAIGDGTANKSYSLAATLERLAPGRPLLDKTDPWRLRYAELVDVPISKWPVEAIAYAKGDATAQADLADLLWDPRAKALWEADGARQTRAAFWLHLTAAWGFRLDPVAVEEYYAEIRHERQRDKARLIESGLIRPDGTKHTKAATARMVAACAARGITPKATKTGGVSVDADAIDLAGDELLEAYQAYGAEGTMEARIGNLRRAASEGIPIQPWFDSLKETGRTSCLIGKGKPGVKPSSYGDQLQNLPRKGRARECYVPRPGYVLWSIDYDGGELCTWAQVCLWMLGFSRLAEAINAGRDSHEIMGASILNAQGTSGAWDYDRIHAARKGTFGPELKTIAKDARQLAKIPNFGLPGGMGAKILLIKARTDYDITLPLGPGPGSCMELVDIWKGTWDEAGPYFNEIRRMTASGSCTVEQFISRRIRGNIPFTVAANGFFQALLADAAKDAGWEIIKRMYDARRGSSLYGSRMVNFAHDEFIGESPEEVAHEAAHEAAKLAVDVAQRWVPDVKMSAAPALMRRWYKAAEPVYDANGRLIPWEPPVKAPALEWPAVDRGPRPDRPVGGPFIL